MTLKYYMVVFAVYQNLQNYGIIRSSCDIGKINFIDLQRRKFPHIFVIGFGKSGTYAVTKSLQMDPNIIIRNNDQKTKYFDQYYFKGLCWYLEQMKNPS